MGLKLVDCLGLPVLAKGLPVLTVLGIWKSLSGGRIHPCPKTKSIDPPPRAPSKAFGRICWRRWSNSCRPLVVLQVSGFGSLGFRF